MPGLSISTMNIDMPRCLGTVVSVLPVTATLGAAAGGFIGYELMSLVEFSSMPPEAYAGLTVFAVHGSAIVGGATSWISGAVYTGKKWYNTYKAIKRSKDITDK